MAPALLSEHTMRSLPLAGEPPAARSRRDVPLGGLSAAGFRPFFLAAALLAVVMVPLWLAVLHGKAAHRGMLEPMVWHAHEMVFGFAAAVIAGFLLTAVRNWTGRETATGGSLVALVVLWAAGRVAITFGSALPAALVAVVDVAFLPALAVTIAVPIVKSDNRRNRVMIVVVTTLAVANALVHLGALGILPGWELRATRAAVHVVVLLAALIAGRVIPMFTRNATSPEGVVSVPALDVAAAVSIAAYVVADFATPGSFLVPAFALVAAVLILARAARWGLGRSLRNPLLWILHFGHAWIAAGLALRVASAVTTTVPASAATHALTVGAIGSLCLGMMARVSLGHTGRPLTVRAPMTLAFATLTLAAVVRVLGPWLVTSMLGGLHYGTLLVVSGVAWAVAFGIFFAVYMPVLVAPRVDGKPG